MAGKWKHSLAGLALISATVAAPATASIAGAQTSWGGFAVEATPTVVNLGGGGASPAFGAATTTDLGGAGVDIWVNNHALLSEALVDRTGPSTFAGSQLAPQDGIGVDSHGSYFGDLDGDGDDDLIETAGRNSINRVFINNNGTLEFVPDTGIESFDARARSVLLVDIDNDDDLDALVANLDRTLLTDDNGDPLDAAPSALFLNDGTGTNWTEVADVNDAISDENIRFVSLTSTGPGTDQVIITSNSFAFGIDTLRTGVASPIVAVNPVRQSVGAEFDNMSQARDIALGDLDGDLDIEFVVARQQDRLGQDLDGNQVEPSLQGTLPIGIGQVGIGGPSSLEVVQNVSSDALVDNCRTVALADFDNDADIDIFGGCTFLEGGQDTNVILLNDGDGNFTVNSSLVPTTGTDTAAVAIATDVNDDGWVDTYVGNGFDTDLAQDDIFLNQGGNGNHWLKIDLEADGDNAAGAQVFVGTDIWQVRETGHRNHRGQDMSTLHFGLGDQEEVAPVEIQWPDGTFESCTIAGIDQTVTITQGSADCVASSQSGLVAAVNVAPVLPAEPEPATCEGLTVTVDLNNGDVPTEGNDVILGTPENDVIDGLSGRDVICGGDGADTIIGGAGADTIYGGQGQDTIEGGIGADIIFGQRGKDDLSGNKGQDVLNGGKGNDVLNGGKGNDQLFGNNGDDTLRGDNGRADTLRGGNGLDSYDGGSGNNDGCTNSDPAETRVNCEDGVAGR